MIIEWVLTGILWKYYVALVENWVIIEWKLQWTTARFFLLGQPYGVTSPQWFNQVILEYSAFSISMNNDSRASSARVSWFHGTAATPLLHCLEMSNFTPISPIFVVWQPPLTILDTPLWLSNCIKEPFLLTRVIWDWIRAWVSNNIS